MERKQRAKMPASQRAKQFMPFAAVKGLEKTIAERNQMGDLLPPSELEEEEIAKLDTIIRSLKKGMRISVYFFNSGQYLTYTGTLEEINAIQQMLHIDGNRIPFHRIKEVYIL